MFEAAVIAVYAAALAEEEGRRLQEKADAAIEAIDTAGISHVEVLEYRHRREMLRLRQREVRALERRASAAEEQARKAAAPAFGMAELLFGACLAGSIARRDG